MSSGPPPDDGCPPPGTVASGAPEGTSAGPADQRSAPWSSNPPGPVQVPPEDVEELLLYVREALGRFGVVGQPHYSPGMVLLRTPQELTRARLGSWARRWSSLDEPTRQRRCTELARALVHNRTRTASPPRRHWSFNPGAFAPAVLALAALLGAFFLYREFRSGSLGASPEVASASPPRVRAPGSTPEETPAARDARAARRCAETRARVVRGATVSTTDADGWVIEVLGLSESARQPLTTSPRLNEYLADANAERGSKLIWAEEPDMVAVDTSSTLVSLESADLVSSDRQRMFGLRLTFSGTLVETYFNERSRAKFFHLASALSRDLELSHAGLFARCADGNTHHLGSWFLGHDDGAAAAAMMFSLGAFANPPHIALPEGEGGQKDRFAAFEQLRSETNKLDRAFMAQLLGRHGGRITGPPEGPAVITFPFRDGNRASRASRELARLLEIAPELP